MEENKDYQVYRFDYLTEGSQLKLEHNVYCEDVDISTYFYPFPQYSTKYSYERVPEIKQVRAFFISERRTSLSDFFLVGGTPGCRSPPSDFDFAYQLKN